MNHILENIKNAREIAWTNPYYDENIISSAVIPENGSEDAYARLDRFAPYIAEVFPETAKDGGLIESPLREIPSMKAAIGEKLGKTVRGRLFLKMDSHLAIAGSIKARGGIYEVLKHAEDLALASGEFSVTDNYAALDSDKWRSFFSRYTVQVGSTGNLGMSIGIMSAALGFKVKIHMSSDAKQWKKDLLRSRGCEVLEYESDYSLAVAEGRKASDADPMSHFVDDERSLDLFLGYSTAAKRLKKQLDEQGIEVNKKHPLIVYLPAGVGGAPGGIAYGLKQLFGADVHCFFCEPTLYPSVTLGIMTQQHEKVNVNDYGLGGITEADGLACASPSGLVTRIMTPMLSGSFTVADLHLYDYLRMLHASENTEIEPSSCAAFAGVCGFDALADYRKLHGLTDEVMDGAVQIAWATGGVMIPEDIKRKYLEYGI